MKLPIYFDYMATTPVDPRVKEKMDQYLTFDGCFGNPASSTHSYGWCAREAVELARAQVADLINADGREIVWTSGATEANNLAIKGAAQFYQRKGKHIVTCKTEHKAVLDVCCCLEAQGFEITYLTPEKSGLIALEKLAAALRTDTILVSIMMVNNETGVIQNVQAIGELIKPKGIVFHVDAAQAAGKVAIDVAKVPADLMSFSAHKAYGPKGIGALYVRHQPRIRLAEQLHGGGHEFGMRSGTLATHQIAGMGETFRILKEEGERNCARVRKLRDKLLSGIELLGDIHINGDMQERVANNLNVSFVGVRGADLLPEIKDLAVSTGSACNSTNVTASHVLAALGLSNALALSTIRFSLGNYTTEDDVNYAINCVTTAVKKLRG